MQSVKCVVVGDGAVGKTCMLISFISGEFPDEYVPTVFDNYTTTVTSGANNVSLTLWDTAGQEDYDRLRPLSYSHTNVFLVCFSVESYSSFENVTTKWIPEVEHYGPGVPIILIATKIDFRENEVKLAQLKERRRAPITYEQGLQLSKNIGAVAYLECSAKEMVGLTAIFEKAVDIVLSPSNETSSKKPVDKAKRKRRCIIL